MKILTANSLFLILFFSVISCRKDKQNLTVHGHVRYNDMLQTPAKKVLLSLSVFYDTGSGQDDLLGRATSNEAGYYEISNDVSVPVNSFKSYILGFNDNYLGFSDFVINSSSKFYSGSVMLPTKINDGTSSVIQDITIPASGCVKFHIKNATPFNNNDKFLSIRVHNQDESLYGDIILNSSGQQVDTSVYFSHYCADFQNPPTWLKFESFFEKDGVYTPMPKDSVTIIALDTVQVNINY